MISLTRRITGQGALQALLSPLKNYRHVPVRALACRRSRARWHSLRISGYAQLWRGDPLPLQRAKHVVAKYISRKLFVSPARIVTRLIQTDNEKWVSWCYKLTAASRGAVKPIA